MTDIPINRTEALALEPGDILVVTLPEDTTHEQFKTMAEFITDKFPDQNPLVVTAGITIDAYRPVNP